MDIEQQSELKSRFDRLVKRGLYMGSKKYPDAVTGIEVYATDDLYDEYEDIWYEAEMSNDGILDYDRLTTGILARVNIINRDPDDNTYESDSCFVGYPIEDPMQVITNTKTRKSAVKYMINDLLGDYDDYSGTASPIQGTKKLKFWLRQELTKKLKHLK